MIDDALTLARAEVEDLKVENESLRAENARLREALDGIFGAFENVTFSENSKQLYALRAAARAAMGETE